MSPDALTSFAIVFVWISGATLLWSRYEEGGGATNAWFHAKLAFVLLFTIAHVVQRRTASRMRRAGDAVATRRQVERWVSVAWLMSLLAICAAVLSFG